MRYLAILSLIFLAVSCRQPKGLVYEHVQDFKLEKLGLKQTAMSMNIQLYNPNKYSIKLKKADVDVFLNDNHLGKLVVKGPYNLAKLDTFLLPVTLDVDIKNVLPNALQLLFDNEADVKLHGTIIAGRHGIYLPVPINYEGKQDILQGLR